MNLKTGLMLLMLFPSEAFSKDTTRKATALRCTYAVSYTRKSPVRTVGRIYELNVEVLQPNIRIDSVWFGDYPLPCEIRETKHGQLVQGQLPEGTYLVKVNRDLYKNFPEQYPQPTDKYQPRCKFSGELMILYSITDSEKKGVLNVKHIKPTAPKPER